MRAEMVMHRSNGGELARSALRHRVRRALLALQLSEEQRDALAALREERQQLGATRQLLTETRRALREALSLAQPDSEEVCELLVQERVFCERERALAQRLDATLAALLTPRQATRIRALGPAVLDEVLVRLVA